MWFHCIDGPEMLPGPKDHYVLSGDPISLICGYDLVSNPPAIVSWTNPLGATVTSGGKYSMDSGPQVVRLNISNISEDLAGKWMCHVKVADSRVHKVSESGRLIQDHNSTIGHHVFETYLTVIGKYESVTQMLEQCHLKFVY